MDFLQPIIPEIIPDAIIYLAFEIVEIARDIIIGGLNNTLDATTNIVQGEVDTAVSEFGDRVADAVQERIDDTEAFFDELK